MTQNITINSPPRVILWFKIYCCFLCLLYLATAAFSVFLFFVDPSNIDLPPAMVRLYGVVLLVLCLLMFAVCLLPLVLSPRPWLWTFDLVVICFGLTSACFLPASIPLLIFWIKPDVKQYFGKS